MKQKGEVTHRLELPPQLSVVHDVFHVSQLKKRLRVPEEQVSLEDLVTRDDLTYGEYHVKLLETSERVTQNKKIVQGSIESPHRRRSHLGKGRRIEGRISKLLCKVVRISRARFLLRGVGFSRPQNSNLKRN
jgi:hypothetical protein